METDLIMIESYLAALLESLGGIHGLSTLGIVTLLVQLIGKTLRVDRFQPFFDKKFGGILGKHRLAVIYGSSIVLSVTGLMSQGIDFFTALIHGNTLAAYNVFAHQIYKQRVKND